MVKPKPLLINKKIASSSLVRNLLQKGKLEKANKILNRNWSIYGKVQKGTTRKHTDEAVPLKLCVGTIIEAIEKDLTTVYIPKKLSFIPFLKLFFNGFLEKKVFRAINENKK